MTRLRKTLEEDTTRFLNVDLDLYSRSKLDPLVAAFGKKMIVLYVGRELNRYSAHLELNGFAKSADAIIQGICKLIRGLPHSNRKLWDAAIARDFNIGIQAAARPKPFEIAIEARTIQMVSSLNARLVVTVYPPQ